MTVTRLLAVLSAGVASVGDTVAVLARVAPAGALIRASTLTTLR